MATQWRNWTGNARATPLGRVRPRDAEHLAQVLDEAGRHGQRVKAVGAGHSFPGIAVTDGLMIDMRSMSGIEHVHRLADGTAHVRVGAGTRLRELNHGLARHGLALRNLGDIDHQTIAGAIATGTHGTGGALGGLPDQVVGLRMVLADGRIVDCDAGTEPDLFAAGRCSLGAIGVAAAVTLRCVPAFLLAAREDPLPLDAVLATMDLLIEENDHVEFFWFPHTDVALTKRNNVAPGARREPESFAERFWTEDAVSNGLFEVANRLATGPLTIPINRFAAHAQGPRRRVDDSYKVFASPRRVRFTESEYALPRAALPEVMDRLRHWFDRTRSPISFPVEVRFSAADDVWMSPAHGRATVWLAVHQYHRRDYRPYFRAVSDLVQPFEARPHWGKLHRMDADDLRERYPRFEDFLAVRDVVDPRRMFANRYLDRVLGG